MIDKSRLYLITEVEKLRDQLNEAEYPEVYGFIDHLWTGGELENISPYDIAGKLMELDSPKAFPRYIISFIEQLYMIEIKAGNADAMNDLGAHYYEANRGFAQDFEKAVNLLHDGSGAREPCGPGESRFLLLLRQEHAARLREGLPLLCSRGI